MDASSESGGRSFPHHYADRRKVGGEPRTPLKPDGTPDDNDRLETGPTDLAFAEWREKGITPPNLPRMRAWRLERLQSLIRHHDLAGVLLFDPMNIRYATDCPNFQVWNLHNPYRACYVSPDGYMIVWDFDDSGRMTAANPLVREARSGAWFFCFLSGDKVDEDARRFAGEIRILLDGHAGGNRRLAVDKIPIHGVRALEREGIGITDGEALMERVRSIKGADEIAAIRCAMEACNRALAMMYTAARPGVSEADVWSVLHAENIRRGGEWIETRLLTSGPRTNPWLQECGPRIIQDNELVAFDTDLIGCYGMCIDISRTWFVGPGTPSPEQRRLYREAHTQIQASMDLLVPGRSFRELTFSGRPLPDEFAPQRYVAKFHGVGLADEWPLIPYPRDWREGMLEGCLEPGMVLAVESYVGAVGGREGVRLEDQVLVTEQGCKPLTTSPNGEISP